MRIQEAPSGRPRCVADIVMRFARNDKIDCRVNCGFTEELDFGEPNDNENDNDNDTLREVPHQSNEGLALQARVSGP